MTKHMNPLLGKNFFNLPGKVNTDVPLAFPLPTENNCAYLTRFLRKSEGASFKVGISQVLDEFHDLMLKQGLINQALSNPTKNLKERLLLWNGDNNEQNAYLFPLFTQGIQFLKNIIDHCNQQTPLSPAQNHLLSSLAYGIQVCGPGSYTNICDTHLSLLSCNLDEKLMAERKRIAQEVATTALAKSGPYNVGWEIHYVNTLLNFNSQEIGIRTIDDPYSTEVGSVETASKVVDFGKKFYSAINVEKIINHLSDSVNLDNELLIILDLIKKDKVDQLSDHLASTLSEIGIQNSQSLFNLFFNTTFDEDDNVTAELRSNAKEILKIHLLHSLTESEHLKISDFKIELPNGAEMYLFPGSISKLSHVKAINDHGYVVYYNIKDYLKLLEDKNKNEEATECRQRISSITKNKLYLDALKDKNQVLNTLNVLEELINNGVIEKSAVYEMLIENIDTICARGNGKKSIFTGKKLFDLLLKSNPKNITDPVDYLISLNDETLCKVLSMRTSETENLLICQQYDLGDTTNFTSRILERFNSLNDKQFINFLRSNTSPHHNSYSNFTNLFEFFINKKSFPRNPDEIILFKKIIEKTKTSELSLSICDLMRLIEIANNRPELREIILPLVFSFPDKIDNHSFINNVEKAFNRRANFNYIPFLLPFLRKLPDDEFKKKNFFDILKQFHKAQLSEIMKSKDIICKVMECFEPSAIISLLSHKIIFSDSENNITKQTLFSALLNKYTEKSSPDTLLEILEKFNTKELLELINSIPKNETYRLIYFINTLSPEKIKNLCEDGLISAIHYKNNSYLLRAVFKKINQLSESDIFSLLSSEKIKDDLSENNFEEEPFLTTFSKLTPEHAKRIAHTISSDCNNNLAKKIDTLAKTKDAFEEIRLKIINFKEFLNNEYQQLLANKHAQKTIPSEPVAENITLENQITSPDCLEKHEQTLFNNMQEQYRLCNTFLDKLTLKDAQPLTISDYQTGLKSLADCMLEDENKKKIKSHIRDTRFKKCIAGIIIVLTGVLPALIALGIKALVSSKRHFSLFTSEGDKVTNDILDHVKRFKP